MYKQKRSFGGRKNNNKRGGGFGGRKRGRGRGFGRGRAKSNINIEGFINKIENEPKKAEHVVDRSYSDFNLDEGLMKNIIDKGFEKPTAIQDQAIPAILDGKDFIGLANTGTGKTAAYLIPLMEKVIKNKNSKALIIAPTRELASQINNEFYSLKSNFDIFSVLITGGANMGRQIKDLRRNYNFLIVTPGRLKDLIQRNQVDLSKVDTLVLDEVDRMLDMGFVREIKYFIDLMPQNRQSLFFSATFSPTIEKLIRASSNNPVKVDVTRGITAENIVQNVIKFSNEKEKVDMLHDILISDDVKKTLIFGQTKAGVNRLGKELRARGFKVDEIHGNKRQAQRTRSLKTFKDNGVDILVATDVASRGIDVDDITHVINYELPNTFEDYVHRIGRTGRANKKGHAVTFVKG